MKQWVYLLFRATNDFSSIYFHMVLGFYYSLRTTLFPVKSFPVSSLLDYPAVADAFRQSNITRLSSAAVERLFSEASQVLTHAWLMRQWTNWCSLFKIGNDFTDWKGCLGVLNWLKTAGNNCCQRFYLIISLVFGTD